jgi:hypothetical protein
MAKTKPAEPQPHYAAISLSLGILSILIPVIGIILGILAIVFYAKQQRVAPSGMATAGMVCGIVGLVLNIVAIIAAIIAVAFFFAINQPDAHVGIAPNVQVERGMMQCTIDGPFSCGPIFVDGANVSMLLKSYTRATNLTIQGTCPGGQARNASMDELSYDDARITFACPQEVTQWDMPLEISYTERGSQRQYSGFLHALSAVQVNG